MEPNFWLQVATLGVGLGNLALLGGTYLLLRRLDEKLQIQGNSIRSIINSVSTTQSNLKRRQLPGGAVMPVMSKPKADQHYENRGVQRSAPRDQESEAGRQSAPVRIGKVERVSKGGKPRLTDDR